MPNYRLLNKFLPAAERELVPIERATSRELGSVEHLLPEVQGAGQSRAKFADALPIEEADTLSPRLNSSELPKSPIDELYRKYKMMVPVMGAGAAATVALNSGDGEGQPPIASTAPAAQQPAAIEPPKDSSKDLQAKFHAMKSSVKPSHSVEESPKEAKLKDIDFGEGHSIASDDRYKQAQNLASQGELVNSLGKSGSLIGASIAGAKPGVADSIFDANIKSAQGLPKQYEDRVKFEKEDPNSSMSKGYKELAKSMGFNIQGNASAADIEKIIPQFANIYNQEQARIARGEQGKLDRESRADMARERALDRSAMREMALGTRQEQQKNKFIESAQVRIGKEFEKYQKVENSLDSLEQAKKDKVGASDVTMLYNFIKAQDPESVVREGEIALGQRGMSLGGRLRTMTLGQLSGEMLDPKFRNDIVKIARRLKDQGYTSYNQSVQTIRDTAKQRYGMSDDELTLIDPVLNRQKKKEESAKKLPPPPASSAPLAPVAAAPVGTSGLTPEQRRKRIEELKAKQGIQ